MLRNQSEDSRFLGNSSPDAGQLITLLGKLAVGDAGDAIVDSRDGNTSPRSPRGHSDNYHEGGGVMISPRDVERGEEAHRRSSRGHVQLEYEKKEEMEDEVKRISLMYNEEQQKLDLMMKIQQARQRQSLQKKLLERRLQQDQQQIAHKQIDAHTGDNNSHQSHTVAVGSDDRIHIGATLSPKKYGPSNTQPVFKGLDATANLSIASAGNTNMSMRGMNLGPLMKRK
jgi:hypothetical protein